MINYSDISFEDKIQICMDNNNKYDGYFFLAVKSTGIFCLPSCKAKFPLRKNISFYDQLERALSDGYRPCKRCHPDKYPNNYPNWLNDIKTYIEENFNQSITEQDLITRAHVDITTIRRYFRTFFATSPKSYQNQKRLDFALKLLEEGEPVDKISSLIGYSSTKAFKTAFKNFYGYYPRDQHEFYRNGH